MQSPYLFASYRLMISRPKALAWRPMHWSALLWFALCSSISFSAETSAPPIAPILNLEQRARFIDQIIEERVATVLPGLMRRTGIDCWIMVSREYNEDPVLKTFLPANWLSARRTTILAIFDHGPNQPLETIAVARYPVGTVFKQGWFPEDQPDQWTRLLEIVSERDPKTIGINTSDQFALADGLSRTEHQRLTKTLHEYAKRIQSAESLAIGWLETRSASEQTIYPSIVAHAQRLIKRAFSSEAINLGTTTTRDLEWWLRESVEAMDLEVWFHPSVSRQFRSDQADSRPIGAARPNNDLIQPGDLLHVDFGIKYLRLNTDTQQHAYILRRGEVKLPLPLQAAFRQGNALQDLLMSQFASGRTGNEILLSSLALAKQQGINGLIYTHPLGLHGHGAGPTIGLWDQQTGIPGRGDYKLFRDTAHSIELSVTETVEDWEHPVRIMLEEDAFFDGNHVRFLSGRQTTPWLVPRQ